MSDYFSGLNYSLANEDTSVEFRLLHENARHVFVIPSSGAQALPLLARHPQRMDIADISEPQLFLTELRLAALRACSYEEWLYFMGYRGGVQSVTGEIRETRRELFARLDLRAGTRDYWQKSIDLWADQGFITLGRWERFFLKLSKGIRTTLRYDFQKFFDPETLEKQREVYDKQWPDIRFRAFLEIVTSDWLMNRVLYRGSFSGKKGRRTSELPPAAELEKRYRLLFENHLARKNFFLQMLFLGGIKHEEGLPIEAQRDVFEAAKAAKTEVRYIVGSLTDLLPLEPYDFMHLSDVISYLEPKDTANIVPSLHADCPKGAMVVARTFLKSPAVFEAPGWSRDREAEIWSSRTDGTGVYDFLITRKL